MYVFHVCSTILRSEAIRVTIAKFGTMFYLFVHTRGLKIPVTNLNIFRDISFDIMKVSSFLVFHCVET